MSDDGPFPLRAGRNARKFVCEGGCGETIIVVGFDPGGNVCFVCNWLNGMPGLTPSLRDRLRVAHGFARSRTEGRH